MADDEALAVGLDEVDVAVRRAEQRGRPGQDRLEQLVRVVPVQQRQGRLVERRAGTGRAAGSSDGRVATRLGQVQRLVGDRDQRVLRRAVLRDSRRPRR